MYLRWQYVGPSWEADAGKNARSRRITDKHPMLADGRPMCRYRLAVVEARRPGPGRPPRARVVVYLSIVDEAQLHPSCVSPRRAFANRNALVVALDTRLKDAVTHQRMTEAQRAVMRDAIGRAFPRMHPPAGRSYVVIPARVFARAAKRFEPDGQAVLERRSWAEVAKVTGMPLGTVLRHVQKAEARKRDTPDTPA